MSKDHEWWLLTSHGLLLMYVAAHPRCDVVQISEAMSLTRRTVWGVLGDLRRAGMLLVNREGRRHFYTVNFDAPFVRTRRLKLDQWRLADVFGRLSTAEQESVAVPNDA